MPAEPEHRSILALDIERFGWPERTNPGRLRLRAALRRLCQTALKLAGVMPEQYVASDTGDGFLVSVSAEVSKLRLLDPMIPRLARQLNAHNRTRPAPEQIRLRVAVHAGDVLRDPDPLQGDATIFARRLLDTAALRASLAATEAPLALIVSQTIYDNIVKHHYRRIDPATYHAVLVDQKEASGVRAWVHVPDDPDAPLRAALPAPGDAPGQGVTRIPRELPARPRVFIGRQQELSRILGALGGGHEDGATVVVAIDGAGGAGKSALAIRAAHQVVAAYPDGQLYLDLQGTTPAVAPLSPAVALARLLGRLGVGESAIPARVEDAAARYRSLLADRRVLVVLDNASDGAQVRPLLPGGAGCAVVVTSRSVLSELDVTLRLTVGVLPPEDATLLLARLAGREHTSATTGAAAAVARHCGHLPLALRIAGARLAAQPAGAISVLARRLGDEHRRLDELRFRDLAVRASLEISYRALQDRRAGDADLARVFRLLALVDSPDVSSAAVAALLDWPLPATERALERLVDEHLLESPTPGRFRFHDLVRLLAREHALREEPPAAREAALRRLLGYWLASTQAAARLIRPSQQAEAPDPDAKGRGRSFGDRAEALAWLEAERARLVAAVTQATRGEGRLPVLGVQLAHTLFPFFHLRSYLEDWERVGHAAVQAARRLGDLRAEGQARNALGLVAWRQHRYGDAAAALHESLRLRRAAGDREGEGSTLNNLGIVLLKQQRPGDARDCFTRSLALRRETGDRLEQGETLNNLGNAYRELGELGRAAECHQQSLSICRELGDRHGEGNALHSLGETYRAQGRLAEAVACFTHDLAICRELGDLSGEAVTLGDLGEAHRLQGRLREAVGCLHRSLHLHRLLDDRHAQARVLQRLSLALQVLGRAQPAEVCRRAAAQVLAQPGEPAAR